LVVYQALGRRTGGPPARLADDLLAVFLNGFAAR
jgi:hypothetical protein